MPEPSLEEDDRFQPALWVSVRGPVIGIIGPSGRGCALCAAKPTGAATVARPFRAFLVLCDEHKAIGMAELDLVTAYSIMLKRRRENETP